MIDIHCVTTSAIYEPLYIGDYLPHYINQPVPVYTCEKLLGSFRVGGSAFIAKVQKRLLVLLSGAASAAGHGRLC